jgi:hypothetical protein
MEPASKCFRFYEYHTVGYTTLWDLMSIDCRLSKKGKMSSCHSIMSPQNENVRFVQSRNVRFSKGREARWKKIETYGRGGGDRTNSDVENVCGVCYAI